MSSGRDIGDAHVEALQTYLSKLRGANVALPHRGGKVHLTAVAKACGFNREVLYQNPRCKALLAEAAANLGLTALETRADVDSKPETAALERRITQLERHNASLYAEVHELRRQLRQFQAIEAVLTESGRRVIP
jgi:hypothetical protein